MTDMSLFRISATVAILSTVALTACSSVGTSTARLPSESPDATSSAAAQPGRMSGFGYKTAWLAFRDLSQQQVAAALLSDPTTQTWQEAIAASYAESGSLVAVTPPIAGRGGNWVLATGIALLLKEPDVAALSKQTGTEVQYFLSDRVSETHGWERAEGGRLLRAFEWTGDSGELLKWTGRPGRLEVSLGLPDVNSTTPATSDAVFDADIDEESVMAVAGQWSVNPQTLEGAPSARDPLVGRLAG
jgi:hypothetical protein